MDTENPEPIQDQNPIENLQQDHEAVDQNDIDENQKEDTVQKKSDLLQEEENKENPITEDTQVAQKDDQETEQVKEEVNEEEAKQSEQQLPEQQELNIVPEAQVETIPTDQAEEKHDDEQLGTENIEEKQETEQLPSEQVVIDQQNVVNEINQNPEIQTTEKPNEDAITESEEQPIHEEPQVQNEVTSKKEPLITQNDNEINVDEDPVQQQEETHEDEIKTLEQDDVKQQEEEIHDDVAKPIEQDDNKEQEEIHDDAVKTPEQGDDKQQKEEIHDDIAKTLEQDGDKQQQEETHEDETVTHAVDEVPNNDENQLQVQQEQLNQNQGSNTDGQQYHDQLENDQQVLQETVEQKISPLSTTNQLNVMKQYQSEIAGLKAKLQVYEHEQNIEVDDETGEIKNGDDQAFNYKVFAIAFQNYFKIQITDFQQFDFSQLNTGNSDVDGLQELYIQLQKEYNDVYSENQKLFEQLQVVQQCFQQNNIEFDQNDIQSCFQKLNVKSPMQRSQLLKSSDGSPQANTQNLNSSNYNTLTDLTQQQLIEKLKYNAKVYRSKEQAYIEDMMKQKETIQRLQAEKMRTEQMLSDEKRVSDGLQMRVKIQQKTQPSAKSKQKDVFGFDKLKMEADFLIKKAERMGYK